MQHEEFVEAAMLDAAALPLDVAILDVDLGRLREARELLVGGLGRDDARLLGTEAIEPHGEAAGKQRVKLHEPGPGLVKQDVVAQMADLLDDQSRIVDGAVIGALLDDGDAERARAAPGLLVGDQRVVADFLADGGLIQRLVKDRPDQSMGITVGLEKNRNTAADEQRAVMGRLVVVAIEQHEVALGN